MRRFGRRTGGRLARLSAFAVLALALVVSGAGPASAGGGNGKPDSTGNNGTLKILAYGSDEATNNNEPHVCAFKVEGFNFDPGQHLAIAFLPQAPTKDLVPPEPNLYEVTSDANGYFITDAYGWFNGEGGAAFVAGHYKVVALGKDTGSGKWTELDKAKSKVFWVDCGTPVGGTGRISVTKTLAEGSASADGTSFAITVACEKIDFNETFHLKVDETATTIPLPVDTACAVSEKTTDGWQTPTITPNPVTVQTDATVAVTVTNFKPRDEGEGKTGTVTVTKELADGSQADRGQTFPVTVTCEKHEKVVYAKTFDLKVGEPATTDPLPVGTKCTVSENPPTGWDTPTFEPSATVTVKKGDTAVTVVNSRTSKPPEGKTGKIKVTKELADGSLADPGQTFPITVVCEKAGYTKTFEFDLAAGKFWERKGLPDGAVCTVREAAPSGWANPTYDPPSGQVTVVKHTTVEVTVVNSRTVTPPPQPAYWAGLTLTKENKPADVVEVGKDITYTLTATATGNISQSSVVVSDVVPTGTTYLTGSAKCVAPAACTAAYNAATRTVSWPLGAMNPGDSIKVTFKVTVNKGLDPKTVITNVGQVTSAAPASAVSNEVVNRLAEVKGEVIVGPTTPTTVTPAVVEGETLPATGAAVPVGYLLGTGVGLIALGALLTALTRRSRSA
jgi:fimbrial isopeptide formation D2 family protein